MKPDLKVAVAQINPTVGDLQGNTTKIIAAVHEAREQEADLVIFPEQAVTGYPCYDLLLHQDFIRDTCSMNEEIVAKACKGITAIVGSIERSPRGANGKELQSVALVIQNQKKIATVAKTLLPTYDVFSELRYFTPAKKISPVGVNGTKLGIQLCEDMWDAPYHQKVTEELVRQGADFIINLSASPYTVDKIRERYGVIRDHATQYQIPFLYVNMVGAQDELIFDGGSMLVQGDGSVGFQMRQFHEGIETFSFQDRKHGELETLVREEELFRALTLGVKDFFQKNSQRKAVLGLSGGIDSSVTAILACEALGKERVLGVAMPSPFNPEQSLNDARRLAENLGIGFEILPIATMYQTITNELSSVLAGKPFDATEENIQARLRMMVLMAYVNKHGYTLLSTSDKSEIALGYTTLYGDMSGSLAVISDLTKPEVYGLARWYNQSKGRSIIPSSILEKTPSPELRQGQEAPFDYERISPLLEQLMHRVPIEELIAQGYSRDEIRDAYRRFRPSEFKRWQAPISLKCKPTSFGHGRLYPVTNLYVPYSLISPSHCIALCDTTTQKTSIPPEDSSTREELFRKF